MTGYVTRLVDRARGALAGVPTARRPPRVLPRVGSLAGAGSEADYTAEDVEARIGASQRTHGTHAQGVVDARRGEPSGGAVTPSGLPADTRPARADVSGPAAPPPRRRGDSATTIAVPGPRGGPEAQPPTRAPSRAVGAATAPPAEATRRAEAGDSGVARSHGHPAPTHQGASGAPTPARAAAVPVARVQPTAPLIPAPPRSAAAAEPRIEVRIGRVEVRPPRPAPGPTPGSHRIAEPRRPATPRGFSELAATRRHVDRIAR